MGFVKHSKLNASPFFLSCLLPTPVRLPGSRVLKRLYHKLPEGGSGDPLGKAHCSSRGLLAEDLKAIYGLTIPFLIILVEKMWVMLGWAPDQIQTISDILTTLRCYCSLRPQIKERYTVVGCHEVELAMR